MTRVMRAAVGACAVAAVIGGLLFAGVGSGAALASAAPKVPRCETIKAGHQKWGVYIQKGKVSCSTAGKVLDGLLTNKGKNIDKGPGDYYTVYDGWVCPYDQMGIATCQPGSKPVDHPSKMIFALSCSTAQGEPVCPAKGAI
jgi:hypothetical protein